MKILVVDDEPHIRTVLKEFLTREGHEVMEAGDGGEALLKFNSDKYEVVFMDVKMPRIDGVEAFRQIKQSNPDVKVIIISGMLDDETFDRAVTISPEAVEGFLPKPFKPEDIRKCMEKITSGGKWSIFQLNAKQNAALNKLSQVCADNTSTALTQILQKETKASLRNVNVVPLQVLKDDLAPKETSSVCMQVKALGQVSGWVFISLSWQNGLKLTDIMQKRELGATKIFDDRSRNTLALAANILAGSYLNAVTQTLKLSTQPAMPEIIFEQKSKVLAALEKQISSISSDSKYIFTVQTILQIVDLKIQFEVVFIPSLESLKVILNKLGALE